MKHHLFNNSLSYFIFFLYFVIKNYKVFVVRNFKGHNVSFSWRAVPLSSLSYLQCDLIEVL